MKTSTLDRRKSTLRGSNVREVLPEHHLAEYPNLVLFLEKYYNFLDTDPTMSFAKTINDMYKVRNINETPIPYLDLIINEITAGLVSSDFFLEPRSAARLLSIFNRIKGSLYSFEGFFRAFYGIEATVEYPKRNIFTVGQSRIGPENLAIIQDGRLYQIYSLLIKSPIPVSEWRTLYTALLHPAGFYFGSEVVILSQAAIAQNDMPVVEIDPDGSVFTFSNTADASATLSPDISILSIVESDGSVIRLDPNKTIQSVGSVEIGDLDTQYKTIKDFTKITSPSFDEDSDVNGRTIDFSNTIEKFDEVKYTWYDSDSA